MHNACATCIQLLQKYLITAEYYLLVVLSCGLLTVTLRRLACLLGKR